MSTHRGVFLYVFGVVSGFTLVRFLSNYHYISDYNYSLDLHKIGARKAKGNAADHATLSHEALDALPGPRHTVKFKDERWHKGNCSAQVDLLSRSLNDTVFIAPSPASTASP